MKRAKRKQLTLIANSLGFRRRWWGLEPDFLLRKRVTEYLRNPPYLGAARNHPRVKLYRVLEWLRARVLVFCTVLCFGAMWLVCLGVATP